MNGDLRMTPFPAVGAEECEELVQVVLPPERLEEFKDPRERPTFRFRSAASGRFRCNAFRQRGTPGLVLRRVLPSALSATDLGLPPVVTRLAEEQPGPRPGDRADRVGQDHDPGRHDRLHKHQPGREHRHDRGPDRGPPPGQDVDHQPARDRYGHQGLVPGDAEGAPPGPRRHPHR